MKNTWLSINNLGASIDFLASTLNRKLPVFSGTPELWSFGSSAGKKTVCGACGTIHRTFYGRKTRRVRDLSSGDMRVYLDVEIRRLFCRRCQKVKQEKLDWPADSPFYTKRFAFYIGRRCRDSSIQDVAKEFHLDWKTVKALEKQYLEEQLHRAGTPRPQVIGIDEVSIRKGQTYRIVVSDLQRKRPIWFGGEDRSEKSLDLFYGWLGKRKRKGIQVGKLFSHAFPMIYGRGFISPPPQSLTNSGTRFSFRFPPFWETRQ